MSLWPGAQISDLSGQTIVVTGANSGIGFYAALEFARAGAEVVLACRSAERGGKALAEIEAAAPGRARLEMLDLADFASVHDFAARLKTRGGKIDILLNNAGVMAPPMRQTTAQDFELQLGVNFLGHFLLTALLLEQVMNAPAPRIIQVSSVAHRQGRMAWEDLQSERGYKAWNAYRQSKLAMLIFAQELARRSAKGGWGVLSLAAHPGIAATELVANGPGRNSLIARLQKLAAPFIQQPGDAGAWPLILAGIDPGAVQGGYYGPQGWQECRGRPGPGKIEPKAMDAEAGQRLWESAELLTGICLKPGP
ncbi:MAG: SDR family oxidoreductase [Rhodospirillales bacterium]|nr:SDR family oxidoreductase [Rhodospirillales bacterium]